MTEANDEKKIGLMKWILIAMGVLVAIAVVVNMLRDDGGQADADRQTERRVARAEEAAVRVEQERNARNIVGYEDLVQGRSVATQVGRAFTTNRVGNQELGQEAARGAVFVVVEFTYVNTSELPLRALNNPDIQIVGPAGAVYSQESVVTAIYTAAEEISGHAPSDFNPGITFDGAAVFEIAETGLQEEGWMIKVKTSGTTFFVPLDV